MHPCQIGLSVNACELLKSYFCERKQREKLGDICSEWLSLSKGVPQGSLMGPFIFNIFSNNLLLLLEKKCHVLTMLTIQVFYANIEIMILLIMICYHWLAQLYIGTNELHEANPEKFKFINFDKERQPRISQLNHNVTIQSVSNVKLLGVHIDVEHNFTHHISVQLGPRYEGQLNPMAEPIPHEVRPLVRTHVYHPYHAADRQAETDS